VICLDEMGPEAAKSFPGHELVHAQPQMQPDGRPAPAERAKQEADYGRRGKGYIFGAFRPATGEAFTRPYPGRTIANWTDFLECVDAWLPADAAQVFAIQDNLSTHRATDVLLFSLAHPRWQFVFQPTYAAYLNLIEPRPDRYSGIAQRRQPLGVYHGAAPRPPARGAAFGGGPPVWATSRAAVGDRTAGWQPAVCARRLVYAACRVAGEPQRANQRAAWPPIARAGGVAAVVAGAA
jgi:hypothetical protein